MPPGPALYELSLEAARDISWWKHSTQTSTTWTFPSDTAEAVADLVLPQVGYAIDLDLRNTTALLFKNSGTGNFNMVYRRGDGTIGWVEPNRAG